MLRAISVLAVSAICVVVSSATAQTQQAPTADIWIAVDPDGVVVAPFSAVERCDSNAVCQTIIVHADTDTVILADNVLHGACQQTGNGAEILCSRSGVLRS